MVPAHYKLLLVGWKQKAVGKSWARPVVGVQAVEVPVEVTQVRQSQVKLVWKVAPRTRPEARACMS